MTTRTAIRAVPLWLLIGLGISLPGLRSHFLTRRGSVTCDGDPVIGGSVYRSERGDIFVYAPNLDLQLPVVSPKSQELGRCNPVFTPVLGLLFSREAEPSVQCTAMWKGGGSKDVVPPHLVTETHTEFPWGSCPKLRIDY
jgi:hypothetical protein